MNMLIDPNWSKWLKVIKRLKQPGFELHHLPTIDLVLVTHAHFDHLDRRTLRGSRPISRSSCRPASAIWCTISGFNIVHELDYWERSKLGPLKISLTPCHHWGARLLADTIAASADSSSRRTGARFFIAATALISPVSGKSGSDTPIEIALLPDRRLRPAERTRSAHESRGSGARVSRARREKLVPMHYGTFRLGYEPLHEPPSGSFGARSTAWRKKCWS